MRGHKRQTRSLAVLAWMLLGFVAAQLGLNVYLDARHRFWYDAEFSVRIAALERLRAASEERPLLVILGSSRTGSCILPEEMPLLCDAEGKPVVPFNLSHLGAGPVMNLVQLQRLLQAGIRPQAVLIEVLPPALGGMPERIITDAATAAPGDLAIARQYIQPLWACAHFVRSRIRPCYKYRQLIRTDWLPGWGPPDEASEVAAIRLGPQGGDFEWHAREQLTAEEIDRRTQIARGDYYSRLQQFRLQEPSVRALHTLLEVCRSEGIAAALFIPPESTTFQQWYAPGAWPEVERACGGLCEEFSIPLVDARNWLNDADFVDGHHVQLAGARKFSRQLAREALERLAAADGRAAPVAHRHSTGEPQLR